MSGTSGLNLFHFVFALGQLIVHPRWGTCKTPTGHSPTDGPSNGGPVPIASIALVSGSSDYVVCPWSTLLSSSGSLSFQSHISHIEAVLFKAPELLQQQNDDEQPDASQVSHIASLQHT